MIKLATVFALSTSLLPSVTGAATIRYGELTRDDYCSILEFEMRAQQEEATQPNTGRIIPSYWTSNDEGRRTAYAVICQHRLLIS